MAKKKKRKAPAIARTELGVVGQEKGFLVKESYSTVKRRLFTSEMFVEVTLKGNQKITLNKTGIQYITPTE